MTTTNETANFKPETGARILTDGMLTNGRPWQRLNDCDDWDRADFRLPMPWLPTVCEDGLACRVEITGRKVRFDAPGLRHEPVVRVKVTFVGDGEPDQVVGGWALARFTYGAGLALDTEN